MSVITNTKGKDNRHYHQCTKIRFVPPFDIQTYQKCTKVIDPPIGNIRLPTQKLKATRFKKYQLRGDLPIKIQHDIHGEKVAWQVPIATLDYEHYIPLFFDGLCDIEHPYKFLAEEGLRQLIETFNEKLIEILPLLIMPIKYALNTKHPKVICTTLKIIQLMVKQGEGVGKALIPYYRQILPVFNLFKNVNVNYGDSVDYGRRDDNVTEMVNDTLELLEKTGGPTSFINIKYMVPTYESCLFN